MVVMLPAKALHDAFGLNAMVARATRPPAARARRASTSWPVRSPVARTSTAINDGAAAAGKVEHSVHANTLAFNVVPLLGTLDDQGYTDEEMKMRNESRKILSSPASR